MTVSSLQLMVYFATRQILQSIRPTPPNYKAVSEVLKVVYNIVAHYNPSKGGQSKVEEDEDWNQVFDVCVIARACRLSEVDADEVTMTPQSSSTHHRHRLHSPAD